MNSGLKNRKRITLYDVVIILALIISSVMMMIVKTSDNISDLQVEVRKGGKTVYTAELNDVDTACKVCVDTEYSIELLIENDGVSVVHSDCSDKVCVNTGKISRTGQTIVCLPARVAIEIKSSVGSEKDVLDGVVQ